MQTRVDWSDDKFGGERVIDKLTQFPAYVSSSHTVGAKSDQQVNIYSFAIRCDRMWPSTQ